MKMAEFKDAADFLHLFSEDDGLKFLTHDNVAAGFDLVEYVYKCERIILDRRYSANIPDDVYELVRGFVFGPSWIDFKGDIHHTFMASEDMMTLYDTEGVHPLNHIQFRDEFDCFRNSIRFRTGELEKFLTELSSEYKNLNIVIKRNVKGADFYTDTYNIRSAIRNILSSIDEFNEHKDVIISYDENETGDGYLTSSIIIEHLGSFPQHSLSHDQKKLYSMGGTLGTIKKCLDGYGTWSIESRWSDDDDAKRWNILKEAHTPEVEPVEDARGFKHIITIFHKP